MPDYISAKRLREDRAKVGKAIRSMADKLHADNEALRAKGEQPRDWTAEEAEQWATLNREYDAFMGTEAQPGPLAIAERVEKIAAEQDAPVSGSTDLRRRLAPTGGPPHNGNVQVTDEIRALAFQGWMRYQNDMDLTEEQEQATALCGVNPRARYFDINRPTGMRLNQPTWQGRNVLNPSAALTTQVGERGGYTVPTTMVRSLEQNMLAFGGIRQVADVMTTTSGEPTFWPTADDTTNEGRLIGENAQINDATDPTFNMIVFNAYKYTSDFIKIPFELLQDSAFSLAEVVGGMLGERLGRITSKHFTTGDGAAKPYGIVTKATLGVTTASATVIAADELFDLVHSIDPAYRVGNGVGWAFHDNTLLALRKLKDGNGNYMWQQGLAVGEPDRILGFPYTILMEMASTIQALAKVILFGQLAKYKIRDVAGIRLRRLDERFADTDQVGFVALSRHDGNLLDAGTAPVKYMQMHS